MDPFLIEILLQAFEEDYLDLTVFQREQKSYEVLNLGILEQKDKHFLNGDDLFHDADPICA